MIRSLVLLAVFAIAASGASAQAADPVPAASTSLDTAPVASDSANSAPDVAAAPDITVVVSQVAARVLGNSPIQGATAFDEPPIIEGQLGKVTGRGDGDQYAQSLSNAVVSHDSVGDHSITGEVSISDSAFQNMSGLSMVNVNTGNNVAMNASMNVNISINSQP